MKRHSPNFDTSGPLSEWRSPALYLTLSCVSGKMMDFLQEDVDSMQRELDKWKDETKEVTQQIQQEVA